MENGKTRVFFCFQLLHKRLQNVVVISLVEVSKMQVDFQPMNDVFSNEKFFAKGEPKMNCLRDQNGQFSCPVVDSHK